jgi:hypothetical protein
MQDAMRRYELNDTNRRIRNILDAYPQDDWELDEARAMLATLSGIVRVRQGRGDVGLRVSVALTKPTGELFDELVVWEVPGRSDNFDNPCHLTGVEVPASDEGFNRRLA